MLIIVLAICVYNIVSIFPSELRKARIVSDQSIAATLTKPYNNTQNLYPDVYYIVLDEYAGFDVIREYWHEDYVDSFIKYMVDNGFFVTENSRSQSQETLIEIASRLNLKHYPKETDRIALLEDIIDNRVIKIFKSYGYTTIVFYGPYQPYKADYNFDFRQGTLKNLAVGTEEFREVLIDNSFLSAFSTYFKVRYSSQDYFNSIEYVFQKIINLQEMQSPKLVIAHINFPHPPFVVDNKGNILDSQYQYDWNYYLGQHQYATERVQFLITHLLNNVRPGQLPVIVIQSDHGARNMKLPIQDSINLVNYPQDNSYHILFAMHLPGFKSEKLPDNIAPIETFEIILNHYFNLDVEIENNGN